MDRRELISFKNVSKKYGEGERSFFALDDVSFSIDEGEFVVILGPSGAGKSTLLNLLGGMDGLTSGEIWIDGENIAEYSDGRLTDFRASNIGFIFQFYNLIPTLTALENVMITRDIVKSAGDGQKVLLSVGLGEHLHQFPSQLSGGEQQRVSIARAISKNPLMLLCDEPTGALDSVTGVQIFSLLQELSVKEKRTVVVVTHNALLAPVADKVIHMKNGKIKRIDRNENPIAVSEVVW